jgi:hypothetical protein
MAETLLGSMSPASIGHRRCTNETQSFAPIIAILFGTRRRASRLSGSISRELGEGVAIRRDHKTFTVGILTDTRFAGPTKV